MCGRRESLKELKSTGDWNLGGRNVWATGIFKGIKILRVTESSSKEGMCGRLESPKESESAKGDDKRGVVTESFGERNVWATGISEGIGICRRHLVMVIGDK